MLGDVDEEFPLNGGSEKLEKLFEENTLPDISFKFTVPRPIRPKTFQNNVPLKVVFGKTVEAFQMKVGGYSSEGKLGLAIIGNDEYCYYQLYMYRKDERKVASAEIHFNFPFLVREHNYVTFKDSYNIQWSVHFDKSSDIVAFSKEVALARWRSSQGCQVKLVQEAFKGKSDVVVTKNDTVRVSYNIFSLSPENILQEEASGKAVTAPASASSWETSLIGACIKSRRFVIIPSHLCSSLGASVPHGFHVMLDMEIEEIIPPPSVNTEPTPVTSVCSNTSSQISLEKKEDGESLLERMAKIGSPLPSLQGIESDISTNIPDKGKHSFNKTLATTSNVSTFSRDDPVPSKIEAFDVSSSSQFNVLFSEVRTNNSEVRMNLNRVTDKIDSLLTKMDMIPHLNQKVSPALEKFQNVDSVINKLLEQNSAILLHLEKNSPAQLESALNEVVQLKKRNAELESFLEVSGSTCQILKDKVAELNQKISAAESMKNSTQTEVCSFCQSGGERKIKNLEASLKNLQERNYALLEASEHLERQNRQLSEQVLSNQETKLKAQLGEKDVKISMLEKEINKLSMRPRKRNDKELIDKEVTVAVKGVVNRAYKMLKEGLKDTVKDGIQLDQIIAHILKETTADYLESRIQHRTASALFRVDEESDEALDEIPRREETADQGNLPFSPSFTPLPPPVPRPRKSSYLPNSSNKSVEDSQPKSDSSQPTSTSPPELALSPADYTPPMGHCSSGDNQIERSNSNNETNDNDHTNSKDLSVSETYSKNTSSGKNGTETLIENKGHTESSSETANYSLDANLKNTENCTNSKDLSVSETYSKNTSPGKNRTETLNENKGHTESSSETANYSSDANSKNTENRLSVDALFSSYYCPLIPTTPPPLTEDIGEDFES